MRLMPLLLLMLGALPTSASLSRQSYFAGITFTLNGRLTLPPRSAGTPELLANARDHVRTEHPRAGTAWRLLGYWGGAPEAKILIDAAQRDPAELGHPWLRNLRGNVHAITALGWLAGFNPDESPAAVDFLIRCSHATFWVDFSWLVSSGRTRKMARLCAANLAFSPLSQAGARLVEINHDDALGRVTQGDAYDQYQRWTRRRQFGMRATVLEASADSGAGIVTP